MTVAVISPKQLHDRIQAGEKVHLIDVRTPVEFREVHVRLLTTCRSTNWIVRKRLAFHKHKSVDGPLFVICKSGGRGKQACEKIVAAGCSTLSTLKVERQRGNRLACGSSGKKAMSLERQVRIAAGRDGVGWRSRFKFIVAVFGLTAFVGAGLMFAGITDTCGMGMILARMSWNQVSKPASSSSTSGMSCTTTNT